jgi:hypothetical protein
MKRIRAHFSARLLAGPTKEEPVAPPPVEPVAPEPPEEEFPVPEDDEQELSGKDTSLTPAQMKQGIPSLFNKVPWKPGARVFDIGAGKPIMVDSLRQWFIDKDMTYLPYDKYNGDPYNYVTLNELRSRRADIATASNLLNIVAEPKQRIIIYKQMYYALMPGGRFYISVYYDPKKQPYQSGRDRWQNHLKPEGYLDEIKTVFPDARIQSGVITGTKI